MKVSDGFLVRTQKWQIIGEKISTTEEVIFFLQSFTTEKIKRQRCKATKRMG